MTRPRLMAGAFLAASGRASTTPERDALGAPVHHKLFAFLDATGGAEGPWCVRYDAETGPVRVPVRREGDKP